MSSDFGYAFLFSKIQGAIHESPLPRFYPSTSPSTLTSNVLG